MTHEYHLLLNGLVLGARDQPDATAIAWAADTVLAIGSDTEVSAISRGDSHTGDLRGGVVIPVERSGSVQWPTSARLEVGSAANLALLANDPRERGLRAEDVRALVLGGRLVAGTLPSTGSHGE